MKNLIIIISFLLVANSAKTQNQTNFALLADSLFEEKEYTDALENYTKAIELDSLNAELYLKRGKCHVKKQSSKKAINDYSKAIEIDSTYSEAYLRRGNMYKIIGNKGAYERDVQAFENLKNPNDSKYAYTASNGIIYRIGDTIKLGKGANPNGTFRWLQVGGWGAVLMAGNQNYNDDDRNIGKSYAGLNVILKTINRYKFKGATVVYFSVGGGNITNYSLNIEQAINDCEVLPCAKNNQNTNQIINELSVADELLKLKKLLDDKIINQAEFDKLKEKLINK